MSTSSGKAVERRPDGMPKGTPFPKGVSGNPAGKKPGTISLKTHLKNILATELKNEPDPLQEGLSRDMTAGEKIILNWVVKAVVDGDIKAIKDIVETLEGKPAQALNLGGQDGENPIELTSRLEVVLIKPKESSAA